jgi:hypothetical protein
MSIFAITMLIHVYFLVAEAHIRCELELEKPLVNGFVLFVSVVVLMFA